MLHVRGILLSDKRPAWFGASTDCTEPRPPGSTHGHCAPQNRMKTSGYLNRNRKGADSRRVNIGQNYVAPPSRVRSTKALMREHTSRIRKAKAETHTIVFDQRSEKIRLLEGPD